MTDQTLNYTCTICMSLLYEPIQLSCKHLFCMWCMDRWKEQQNFCPLCKTKIDDEQKLEPIMNIHQEIEKLFPEQFKLRQAEIEEEKEKRRKKEEQYKQGNSICVYNTAMVYMLSKQGYIKTDEIEEAMLTIPRSEFIPNDDKEVTCDGSSTPIREIGEIVSSPYTHAHMLEELKIQKGNHILDIGCCCGLLTVQMATLVGKDGSVRGIDNNPKCISLCMKNVMKFSSKFQCNVVFSNGNVFQEGILHKESFDRILCEQECPAGYELEILKLLKPGGIAVIPIGGRLWRIMKQKKDGKDHFQLLQIARITLPQLILPEEDDVEENTVFSELDKKGYAFGCKNCGEILFKPSEIQLRKVNATDARPFMPDGETFQICTSYEFKKGKTTNIRSHYLKGTALFCKKCNLYLGESFTKSDDASALDGDFVTEALKDNTYICKSYVKLFKDSEPYRKSTKVICSKKNCGNVITYYDQLLSHAHRWSFDEGDPESAGYYNALIKDSYIVKNERMTVLAQGLMTVADVFCAKCNREIGWKFVSSPDASLVNECGRFGLVDSRISICRDV